jgi:hypothetical protein
MRGDLSRRTPGSASELPAYREFKLPGRYTSTALPSHLLRSTTTSTDSHSFEFYQPEGSLPFTADNLLSSLVWRQSIQARFAEGSFPSSYLSLTSIASHQIHLEPLQNLKMDDLLPKFLAFPPHPPQVHPLSDERYDEAIKSQIEAVKKMTDTKLLQQTSGGENPLDVCAFKPS